MKNAESAENYDLLEILRFLFFVIAIYLYFIGWIYAHYFFHYFGISLNSVDIPFYYFFVYSYTVIFNVIGGMILVVVILLAYLFTYSYYKKLGLALILIGLIPLFFYVAQKKADREARYKRMGHANTIIFTFKKDVSKFYPKEFYDANKKGKLTILTQTKDRFYIFYQPKGEGRAMPLGFTYDISRADVILAEIEMEGNTEIKKCLGF